MKRRFILITVIGLFLLMLPLVANASIRLATPENVTFSNEGIVRWKKVDNASRYAISLLLDGYPTSTYGTVYCTGNEEANDQLSYDISQFLKDKYEDMIFHTSLGIEYGDEVMFGVYVVAYPESNSTTYVKSKKSINSNFSIFIITDNSIECTQHIAGIDPSIEATCTYTGLTEGSHCSVCGEVLVAQEVIPAKGHTEVIDAAVAPTQTQTGLTEGSHCSVCGEILVAQEVVPPDPESTIVERGTCGYNLNWTLDNEGLLTISGVGEMTSHPWEASSIVKVCISDGVTNILEYAFRDCSSLVSIIIPDGVTRIGYCAFEACNSLSNIILPDSVIEIGFDAFRDCYNLTEVTMSDNVTIIDSHVFAGCSNLRSINIPDKLTSIGYNAFHSCENLANINIPDGVTEIGNGAFYRCSNLTSINIPDNLSIIGQYTFSGCSSLSNITIPGSVLKIDDYAFSDCSEVVSITIPENVKIIGDGAFSNCSMLTRISIPDGIKEIGNETFLGCSSLASISIPDSVTKIGNRAFLSCISLNNAIIPNNVTSIGYEAFWNCNNLTSIIIPYGVMRIGNETFWGCSSLESIIIPDSVTSIGDFAFRDCSNLTSISIPDGVTSIPEGAFYRCENLTSIIIPDSVTSIGSHAFWNCNNLTCITIPNSVISIGEAAFYDCKNLTSITIPDGVPSICNYAFQGCSRLTGITIPESVTSIGYSAFDGCINLTSIIIPDSVTSIDMFAFLGCNNLTSIYIPDGVTNIGSTAFSNCSAIRYATMDSFGAKALSKAGFSFRVPESKYDLLYLYKGNDISGLEILNVDEDVAFFTIPDGVTSIGDYAFNNCNSLTRIAIPDSVQTFGDYCLPSDTVVYCNEYSDADIWATEAGYIVIYLENIDWDDNRIVVLPADFRMSIGKAMSLSATVFPLTDEPSFIWNSNNPSVVSVDNGIITANAIGTATITLSVGTVTDSVNISVYQLADSFQISSSEIWIVAKDEVQLSIVNVEPEGAEANIVWNSSDFNSASVNDDGLVTTKKPGDIVISADGENSIHRECLLHICYPVTAIELESETDELIPNTDLQLTAHVTMRTQSCDNHLVIFTSSNPEIATVDDNGLIHALKPGTATITVESASGITASKSFTVLDVCEVENGELIDHQWGEVEYIWSEDNTAITATRVCQRHEEHIQTETVAVTSQETKSATCTEIGETTYVSDDFENEAFEVQSKTVPDVMALGHTLTAHAKIDSTCTATGTEAYWECEVCGDLFSDEEAKNKIEAPIVIPAKGHSLTAHGKVDATCTATGTKAYWECEVCGDLFSDAEAKNKIDAPIVIPAKGHTLKAHAKVDATCTATGTEAYWECEVCDDFFSDAEAKNKIDAPIVIAAKGHKWNTAEYKWAEDNSTLTATRTCENDESHIDTETVNVTSTIISPTDNTGGSVTYISAEFIKEGFTVQVKNLEIPALKDMSLINLPSMLTSIEDEAFENLSCEAIIIPDGCTSIGSYAFRNCRNLKYISAPAHLEFSLNAFEGCENVVIDRRTE